MQKVLVLGAGLVSRPLVRYLLDRGYGLICTDMVAAKAERVVDGHPNGEAHALDLQDEDQLAAFIDGCDLAVSLVPPPFHPLVARLCIAHGKPMVTASYVSPEMAALDAAAKRAGVVILNEIGVDPGLDHMSAMRVIDGVKARGGRVAAFKSYCGGLPAPEANDNPFGYKFSWAPRGVLMACRNGAQHLAQGRRITVQPERLFRDMHVLQVGEFGDYEAYPNRDSLSYESIYGLEGVDTLFRGTLRNMGWCDCFHNYRKLGLLELDEIDVAGKTYAELMRGFLGAGEKSDLRSAAAAKMGQAVDSLPVKNLEWLGLFGDRRFEVEKTTMLDALGALMLEKLSFGQGERDMVVLVHHVTAEFPGGGREHITSQLIDFGIVGGDSSMSRTVSLPAAIGAHMLLSGKITTPGVLRPVTPEIYNPVLDELVTLGIDCKEFTESF